MPEPFDWSFDGFKVSQTAVQDRLYKECVRYHPEILEREIADTPTNRLSRGSSMDSTSGKAAPNAPPVQPSFATPKKDSSGSPAVSQTTPQKSQSTPVAGGSQATSRHSGMQSSRSATGVEARNVTRNITPVRSLARGEMRSTTPVRHATPVRAGALPASRGCDPRSTTPTNRNGDRRQFAQRHSGGDSAGRR